MNLALPLVITLVVAPAQLKMESGAAPASVTVTATGGTTHLRLWCSAGELSHAQALGDGRFGVSYAPPLAGKPTYAVIAAWDEESGEAGAATLVLIGHTEIPVETEAGAQVVAVVHGHRSAARANAAGHARVPAWVWPGDRTATVTALDAAGNATTNEVALELPPPDGVFVLAPSEVAAGQPVRVYAFATGMTTPQLAATGASLSSVEPGPGATTALLRVRGETTLTASAGSERAQQRIRVATVTPPPERSIALIAQPDLPKWAQLPAGSSATANPAAPSASAPNSDAASSPLRPLSPWELGVALRGTYSGAFLGGGGVIEARRRLRRFAVGLDLDARGASGTIGGVHTVAGGLGLRLAGEARFSVARRIALFVGAGAGGHWAHLRRTPAAGVAPTGNRGGPVLDALGGVLVRVGPGLVEVAVGYAWTPLVGSGLANLDGGTLSVGYRFARW